MTRRRDTIDPAWFDRLYTADPDPWRFETSPYEAAKYAATMEALPPPPIQDALEIGCATGVLTERLAAACGTILAVDGSTVALAQAQQRCGHLPNASFAPLFVPDQWPEGRFDLILLSEVVYYLAPPAIAVLARRTADSLRPGGTALLVHWTGETDYPVSGDDAVALFTAAAPELRPDLARREPLYRLDRLRARPGMA